MTARTLAAAVATVVTAAAVALATAAAPAAHADSESFSDPRGDAERRPVMSPRSTADVVRTVGRHANGRMTVATTVADLTADGVALRVQLLTPRTPYFAAVERRGGETSAVLLDEQFEVVDCPGLRGGVQTRRDRLNLSVPRGCLGRPTWVRFGAATAVRTADDEAVWVDDSRRRGIRRDGALTLGERLAHD